jgi:hypothetical protein
VLFNDEPVGAAVVPPTHGVLIQGASAEQDQANHLRAANASAMAFDARPNTRQGKGVTYTAADWHNPQQFRPVLLQATLVAEPTVGIDTALPYLPGRMPTAGWDGEAGAAAPIAGAH